MLLDMERPSNIRIPDLIQKKRDKNELEPDEIRYFIGEMVKGCIEQAQLGKQNHLSQPFEFSYAKSFLFILICRRNVDGVVFQRNVSTFSLTCNELTLI